MISFFKLYLLLRRNNKLSAKRSVMFEANQYGKLFGYIFLGFMAIYMIGMGTFLGWASAKSHEPAIILLLMPLFFWHSRHHSCSSSPTCSCPSVATVPSTVFLLTSCFPAAPLSISHFSSPISLLIYAEEHHS